MPRLPGIDGCLLTDLSVEEAAKSAMVMRAMASIPYSLLRPPDSGASEARGTILHGLRIPGLPHRSYREQAAISDSLKPLVQAMRAVTSLPLAAGFGISTPDKPVRWRR